MPRSPTPLNSAELEAAARHHLIDQRGGAALLAEQPAVGDWVPAIEDHGSLDRCCRARRVRRRLPRAGGHRRHRRSFARCTCSPRRASSGFGDGLLDAARQEAQRHGCSALEGFALPGDRETKNLYERAGITARKIIVSTRL